MKRYENIWKVIGDESNQFNPRTRNNNHPNEIVRYLRVILEELVLFVKFSIPFKILLAIPFIIFAPYFVGIVVIGREDSVLDVWWEDQALYWVGGLSISFLIICAYVLVEKYIIPFFIQLHKDIKHFIVRCKEYRNENEVKYGSDIARTLRGL